MAEFSYYCSASGAPRLIRALCEELGVGIVPNLNFPSPKVPRFKTWDKDLASSLAINPVAFLAPTDSSIEVSRMAGGRYEGTYLVNLERSLGVLKMSFPDLRLGKDVKPEQYLPGTLYLPRSYRNDAGGVLPSDATKRFYLEVKKCIKRELCNVDVDGQVWVTPDIKENLEAGIGELLRDGRWVGKS